MFTQAEYEAKRTARYNRLLAAAEKAEKDAAIQVAGLKFEHALDNALIAAKTKDQVAVKAHLKIDALKLNEDGTILGLKEQLEPLQKEKDYLFESEEPEPKIVIGARNKNVLGDSVVDAARKGANLPNAEG